LPQPTRGLLPLLKCEVDDQELPGCFGRSEVEVELTKGGIGEDKTEKGSGNE